MMDVLLLLRLGKLELQTPLHNFIYLAHSIFSISHGPPLSYPHGKNLENMKKLTFVRIMNSVSLNSKNIVDSVGILNGSSAINSG